MNAKRLLSLIAGVMLISGDLHLSPAFAADSDSRPADHVWIDRPWNIRYLIHANGSRSMEIAAEVAAEGNAKSAKEGNLKDYRRHENLFARTALIAIPSEDPLATMVITPNKHNLPLTSRLNQLNDLDLATSDSPHRSFISARLLVLGNTWRRTTILTGPDCVRTQNCPA